MTLTSACPFAVSPTLTISPLSLHDALPISEQRVEERSDEGHEPGQRDPHHRRAGVALVEDGVPRSKEGHPDVHQDHQDGPECGGDRKSTRLNSSHVKISYAVFCLKKTTSHK